MTDEESKEFEIARLQRVTDIIADALEKEQVPVASAINALLVFIIVQLPGETHEEKMQVMRGLLDVYEGQITVEKIPEELH